MFVVAEVFIVGGGVGGTPGGAKWGPQNIGGQSMFVILELCELNHIYTAVIIGFSIF